MCDSAEMRRGNNEFLSREIEEALRDCRYKKEQRLQPPKVSWGSEERGPDGATRDATSKIVLLLSSINDEQKKIQAEHADFVKRMAAAASSMSAASSLTRNALAPLLSATETLCSEHCTLARLVREAKKKQSLGAERTAGQLLEMAAEASECKKRRASLAACAKSIGEEADTYRTAVDKKTRGRELALHEEIARQRMLIRKLRRRNSADIEQSAKRREIGKEVSDSPDRKDVPGEEPEESDIWSALQ